MIPTKFKEFLDIIQDPEREDLYGVHTKEAFCFTESEVEIFHRLIHSKSFNPDLFKDHVRSYGNRTVISSFGVSRNERDLDAIICGMLARMTLLQGQIDQLRSENARLQEAVFGNDQLVKQKDNLEDSLFHQEQEEKT